MPQAYEIEMLKPFVYPPRKGFEIPCVAGLSKDKSKLIVRVATQESLLPDDLKAKQGELSAVAKRCELFFGTSSDLAQKTRIEFMRTDADAIPRDKSLSDEEFLQRMTLAVYENGELTMR